MRPIAHLLHTRNPPPSIGQWHTEARNWAYFLDPPRRHSTTLNSETGYSSKPLKSDSFTGIIGRKPDCYALMFYSTRVPARS